MADAADSKSVARKGVWVQVLPPALRKRRERVGFTIVWSPVLYPQEWQLLARLLGKSPKNAAADMSVSRWRTDAVASLAPQSAPSIYTYTKSDCGRCGVCRRRDPVPKQHH